MKSFYLTKQYSLRCLHRLTSDKIPPEDKVWHGHDYKLEVTLCSPLETDTQWVHARDHIDQVVKDKLLLPFDKGNLNSHFTHTTGEALCNEFYNILKDSSIGSKLYSIQLQETRKNRFQSTFHLKEHHPS